MFYLDLFNKLQQFEVQYLLIGGLAVSLHGVERATMDIDITVAMQPRNLDKLIACAESLNLKPVLPVPLSSLKDLNLLKQWHQEKNLLAFALRTEELAGVTLDILLFPPLDFAQMERRMTKFDIANTAVNVVCIDDLIALKQAAGRAIDLSDIEHLNKLKNL
jgi:Nucleotidyl transferase AbiEii toxin, Type IV TA system